MKKELIEIFNEKTILVTGGTGSFGYTVVKRLMNCKFKEIRIFSRDEKKQDDMRKKFNNPKINFYIGDIRDYKSLYSALRGVDFVFHAAALKQVPSCEFFPMEAVKTNIIGTENLLNAALDCKVSKVICLSTDKAVYPINSMGLSKALMEKISIAKSRESKKTIIAVTRFGNVMASRGSVIPLFCQQISLNEPLTITNPNMTRFMMNLNDAVNLVFYAFNFANSGDIYVQKSPSASIRNLSEAILDLFNVDKTKQKIIGTRNGEKLYEVLISREEMVYCIDKGDYYLIPSPNEIKAYSNYIDKGQVSLNNSDEYTSNNTKLLEVPELKKLLLELDEINKLKLLKQV